MNDEFESFQKKEEALRADDVVAFFGTLENGRDLNRVGRMGGTLLIHAIAIRAEKIAKELVCRGASPNTGSYVDPENGIASAYDLAVWRGLADLAIFLHAHGAKTATEIFGPGQVAGFRKGMLEAAENQAKSASPKGSGCLALIVLGFICASSASYFILNS
jgi:hypothetical protein